MSSAKFNSVTSKEDRQKYKLSKEFKVQSSKFSSKTLIQPQCLYCQLWTMFPIIKFTAEWSKTSIVFLDVTVSLVEGVIETDWYVKPTDSHQYLQSSSRHPFHCKKGILYSQALRLNRICSETKSFDKRCNDLEKFLLERG